MDDSLMVAVNQRQVGLLAKEGNELVFNYRDCPSDGFVSLTMPVRIKGFVHPVLHPIFEMHLPEGYLLSVIKKHFSKLANTDDFGLLQLLSRHVKGRVHYESETNQSNLPLALEDLLHPKHGNLFNELIDRFALQSIVSGVQPKVLAQIENKATLRLDDYIVKAWGADYNQLALNEYYCMLAVKLAGVAVPEFYLSDDDALFVMKRFDVLEDGVTLGFEDMCVMQAKQRDHKYKGSYEQVAKTIKLFASPQHKIDSLQQFFKMIVLNNRLQNGDAHLKNFGLLYEDIDSIRLAPAFDVVSTTAYIKSDVPALTLLGSKKWQSKTALIKFAVESCDLTKKVADQLYGECDLALSQVRMQLEKRLLTEKAIDKQKILSHLVALMA
jgi:serine/threonine-protein kinase HipA